TLPPSRTWYDVTSPASTGTGVVAPVARSRRYRRVVASSPGTMPAVDPGKSIQRASSERSQSSLVGSSSAGASAIIVVTPVDRVHRRMRVVFAPGDAYSPNTAVRPSGAMEIGYEFGWS